MQEKSVSTSSVFSSDTTNSKTVSTKIDPKNYFQDEYEKLLEVQLRLRWCLRRPGGHSSSHAISLSMMPATAKWLKNEVRKILPDYIAMLPPDYAELLTTWLLGEPAWSSKSMLDMHNTISFYAKDLQRKITKCVAHIIRGSHINYEAIHFSLVLLRYDRFVKHIKRTRSAETCPQGSH